MGKICSPLVQQASIREEVSLRDSSRINSEEKLIISRALRNVNPDSKQVYRCIEASTKRIINDPDCTHDTNNKLNTGLLTDCDCSEESSDLSSFWNLFKSKRVYKEEELQHIVDVVQAKLNEELVKRGIDPRSLNKCTVTGAAEFYIVPVIVRCSTDKFKSDSATDYGDEFEFELCCCETESVNSSLTCIERKLLEGKCEPRLPPIVFRHCGDLLRVSSESLEPPEPCRLDCLGKSEEIGKWGEFFDLVDRVLRMRDLRLSSIRAGENSPICCDDACTMIPRRRDDFENLERFKDIERYGFSTFCRGLMRWSNCTTKRWNCITKHPHLVIHLPSMSYPTHLRCTAQRRFESLQNVQIGRIGWLVNENAQVLYVCPGKSNFETKCILQNFVRIARPDVSLSRLCIIEKDDDCLCKDVDEKYYSGCESLFYTPSVYHRVRHLSAGRHGFIIPGVLSKTDVLIACELRTSIIGPYLMFQERLLNKRYVLSLLAEARVPHPPFATVRNFDDLCEKMSEMIEPEEEEEDEDERRWPRKWLLKVNCGFCGNQSALISLGRDDCRRCCCRRRSKEDLTRYLANLLPRKLKVNKGAYKNAKDFFDEIERQGGVLTACPPGDYHTVSLGCFIEHDTAKACLRTAADVVRSSGNDCCWNDPGYVIPQTSLPADVLLELVLKLGEALMLDQYIGYFGVDLVVFEKGNEEELKYWVVDIDPYYTDLLSFDDWRRFCLNIPDTTSAYSSSLPCEDNQRSSSFRALDHRFLVCSGKLYVHGLTLSPLDFFVNLCENHGIAYSHKAKTGCMICPLDGEKRTFLMFSFARRRDVALRNFIRALKALNLAAVATTGNDDGEKYECIRTNVVKLARGMEKVYKIHERVIPRKNQEAV